MLSGRYTGTAGTTDGIWQVTLVPQTNLSSKPFGVWMTSRHRLGYSRRHI
jgi:hypothetical protein